MISISLKNMYVLLVIHIIAFIWAMLTGCGSSGLKSRGKINWESFPQKRETLKLHVLRSTYTGGWIWGVTSYPSDQIPSPVDWGWNYSKDNRFAVDWCKAYDVNLNGYIVPLFAKGFTFDANVWKKNYHVFHFGVASVLQQGKIVYILLESLFMYKQRRI